MPVDTSPNKYRTERFDVITANVGSPAPGAFANWPVPANLVVHLVGIQFRVLTNAVVGNRWPYVYITSNGLLPMHRMPVMQLQPENTDMNYSMEPKWPFHTMTPTIAVRMSPLSRFLEMKAGERLRIACFNMDPGDRIQNIRIRYREWRED